MIRPAWSPQRNKVSPTRRNSSAARLGGEEFGLLSLAPDGGTLPGILDDLRRTIEAADIQYGEHRLDVTVSIGVAMTAEEPDIGHALRLADGRLYVAKAKGRNRVYDGIDPIGTTGRPKVTALG